MSNSNTTLFEVPGVAAPRRRSARAEKPPPVFTPVLTGDFSFIATDQSSSVSGICRVRVEGGRPTFDIRRFDLRKTEGEMDKLLAWHRYANALLDEGPDAVVIERPITPFGDAAGSAIVLHKIAGIIEVNVAQRSQMLGPILYRQIAGARLKKWAIGDGGGDKKLVMLAARDRWGEAIVDDNTADSAWLGDMTYHWLAGIDPVDPKRREVLVEVAKEAAQVREEKLEAGRARRARKAAKTAKEAA